MEAQGYYKPSLTLVKLPRCSDPDCPEPMHPLAYDPPRAADICPGCGGPASEPCEERTVDFTGDAA